MEVKKNIYVAYKRIREKDFTEVTAPQVERQEGVMLPREGFGGIGNLSASKATKNTTTHRGKILKFRDCVERILQIIYMIDGYV